MAKKDDEKKGKKRKSAYKLEEEASEPETQEAEDDSAGDDEEAEVIDIEEAREEASEAEPAEPAEPFNFFETKVGKHVQRAVRSYLVDNVVPEGQKEGDVELNVDADFVKEHGVALVSKVFESVTNAVIPKNLNLTVPVGTEGEEDVEEEAPTPRAQPEPGSGFALNLDFGKILRGMFQAKPAEPAVVEAAAAEPEEEES